MPLKYYKNNVLGTLNLVKACKNSMVKNIIFSSSCSIYGNVKGGIVSEKKKPNPQGKYALSKLIELHNAGITAMVEFTPCQSEELARKISERRGFNRLEWIK